MKPRKQKTIYSALGRGPVHPFPARMAPDVALAIVSSSSRPLRILDPMMGSGTVVALARASGHQAIGLDIDPLAVLIADVWTTPIEPTQVRKQAVSVLEKARAQFKSLSIKDAYPSRADEETREFIRYWFDPYVRRQLTALSASIRAVRNVKIRRVLWCAFSRLIITKQSGVSLARDLAHSRPHRSFSVAPIKPFASFLSAVDRVIENCIQDAIKGKGKRPNVKLGDARNLSVRSCSVDLVLTSPPYLNAIDYIRCSKFSLVWMGFSTSGLRLIRSQSVGTEVGAYEEKKFAAQIIQNLRLDERLSVRHRAVLARFIEDMTDALEEVKRVLIPGGEATYIIGENTVRGVYISNSSIFIAIAKKIGLLLTKRSVRVLPQNRRYLPPPAKGSRRASLDSRMRNEVVLTFRKPGRYPLPEGRLKQFRARGLRVA